MPDVIVLVGAGSIGQAIARRVSVGRKLLLADLRQENADAAARTLADAGFDVGTATVDVSSRASVQSLVRSATELGDVIGLIQAAGSRRRRRRSRLSSRSISTAPRSCSNSSAR